MIIRKEVEGDEEGCMCNPIDNSIMGDIVFAIWLTRKFSSFKCNSYDSIVAAIETVPFESQSILNVVIVTDILYHIWRRVDRWRLTVRNTSIGTDAALKTDIRQKGIRSAKWLDNQSKISHYHRNGSFGGGRLFCQSSIILCCSTNREFFTSLIDRRQLIWFLLIMWKGEENILSEISFLALQMVDGYQLLLQFRHWLYCSM